MQKSLPRAIALVFSIWFDFNSIFSELHLKIPFRGFRFIAGSADNAQAMSLPDFMPYLRLFILLGCRSLSDMNVRTKDEQFYAKSPSLADKVSIVIPVRNGGESFRDCLTSLKQFIPAATEVIVVVDGGTDDSHQVAQAFGAKVIQLPESGGPAKARNIGAQMATTDILFFVDADVALKADTLEQVVATFEQDPTLAALIGSYDDAPGAKNFLSQYKNLFHHYTHQTGSEFASTFWGACGAVRRDVFWSVGGFDPVQGASVEDIELGYRLRRAGHRIRLCKQIQVKHLKCWRPLSLLRAEIFYRAVPWTELLWRDRQFKNDLNLNHTNRYSLLLTYALLGSLIAVFWWLPALALAGTISFILLFLNRSVYFFFYQKRGLGFTLQVIPWHWLYFFYGGLAFALGTFRYYFRKAIKIALDISQYQVNHGN